MGILEIARLCQSPAFLPHCFMCSCAGQRPHFELLIRGNGKSICKCWICFLSIASMLSGVFLSGGLMYLTLPAGLQSPAALAACLLSLLFLSSRTQCLTAEALEFRSDCICNLKLKPERGLLGHFFCFSFNCVFSIMQTDANLFKRNALWLL